MDFPETDWFPGTEKPGEDGLYKRRPIDKISGERGRIDYCLWQDGWWYEGSPDLTSALNTPLRKSRYQPGHWEDFEWCGVMPGSYERPDVAEVKAANFVGGFFGEPVLNADPEAEAQAAQSELDLAEIETPPAPETVDAQFASDFFGDAAV